MTISQEDSFESDAEMEFVYKVFFRNQNHTEKLMKRLKSGFFFGFVYVCVCI